MSTMIVELDDALKEANVSEEKARAAATVVADYEQRFYRIERELAVMKWMLGYVVIAVSALLFRAFGN